MVYEGYRYPVFETIRNVNMDDSSEIFSTAFYYPLQKHYYLDTDSENLAILDELWNLEKNKENRTKSNTEQSRTISLDDIMTCKIYPNPVESMLTLEYELKQDAKVKFEIYSFLPLQNP